MTQTNLIIEGKTYTIPELEAEITEREERVSVARKALKREEKELISQKMVLRENSLRQQFERFVGQRPNIKQSVYLNDVLLRFAVKSYYDDIHRYKNYSGSKWANRHKQAAYTIKWLAKFKPIQIREEFDNEKLLTGDIVDVNLIFALTCGFSFLDRKSVDLIAKEKKKVYTHNRSLSTAHNVDDERQSFYDKLLYYLRYRNFTGKQLLLLFEALELQDAE